MPLQWREMAGRALGFEPHTPPSAGAPTTVFTTAEDVIAYEEWRRTQTLQAEIELLRKAAEDAVAQELERIRAEHNPKRVFEVTVCPHCGKEIAPVPSVKSPQTESDGFDDGFLFVMALIGFLFVLLFVFVFAR